MATYDINKDAQVRVDFTIPGPQGPIGLVWRGDHVAGNVYHYRDAVFNPDNGNSYYWNNTADTTTVPLESNGWDLLAKRGAIGPQGPQGIQGVQGIQGIQGIQGEKGLVWRGTWSAATAYAVDNAVTYSNASYRRKVAGTTAGLPSTDTTNWELLAARGATGATGAPGLVWRGTWLASTAYAINDAVTYNGSSYRRKVAGTTAGNPATDSTNWELLASKGDQGIQGPQGIQGIQGATGATGLNWRGAWSATTNYVEDDAVGYNGASWFANVDPPTGAVPSNASTYWQMLASQGAVGPQGIQGIQGERGPQGLTGEKGEPGDDATAYTNAYANPPANATEGSLWVVPDFPDEPEPIYMTQAMTYTDYETLVNPHPDILYITSSQAINGPVRTEYISQAGYDELVNPDPNVLYLIV